MKKKILLIVIASFMLMGVVSAASLWGMYKGNAIVKLNISGVEYSTSSVPPVVMNGQVMIPLNVLKKVGVPYTYDSKKLTITAKKPPVVDEAGIRNAPISWLQLYFYVANEYKNMNDLATNLDGQVGLIVQIGTAILSNQQADYINERIKSDKDMQTNLSNLLVKLRAEIKGTIDYAESNNIDMNEMKNDMDRLDKSFDYFKKSLASVESYYIMNKSKVYGDDYIFNLDKGNQEATDAIDSIGKKYNEFYNLITTYK